MTRPPEEPEMDLICLTSGEPPAADAIATWTCEGATLQLLPGDGTHAVHGLHTFADVVPAVMRITRFEGPRGAAQRAADDLADGRIVRAVQDVPGLAGAVVAVAADGDRLVAEFATEPAVFDLVVQRIFATELEPGEDGSLLTGPTSSATYPITHATHQLRDLPAVAPA